MRRTVPPPSLGPLTTRGSGGLRQPSTTGGHGGGGSGGRLSHTRLQQLLVVLLLLSVTAVAWMVHAHHWAPNLPAIHVPHATFHHHQTAAAGGAAAKAAKAGKATKAAVRQPQTLKTFRGNLEFPLWWHAPFIAQSGLGTEALSIIEALISTKEMAAEDIYITHSGDTFDHTVLKSLSPSTRNLLARRQHPQQVADEWIDTLFPSQKHTQQQRLSDFKDSRKAIAVCHNWFDCWRKPGEVPNNSPGCPCPLGLQRTAFTVARTMFETAGLPAHLAEHVKAMDEVWVPTLFNKDSFAAAGVDPAKIRIVPEGLDTDLWDPALHKPVNISKLQLQQATGPLAQPTSRTAGKKPFLYLFVGKWEGRKGWKELVQGFCDAFKPTDPVELWVVSKPFLNSGEDFDEQIRSFAASHYNLSTPEQVSSRLPRIYTSKEVLSEEDFIGLYKLVDALVIPTHGEGWGRPQIEAMAMELPVITTNWSGPTAFVNDQIAYPLAIDGVVEIEGDKPGFLQGQKWAQPSLTHLTQLLKHVFAHRSEAQEKGKLARQHIQQHFTSQVVARVVAAEVKRLQPIIRARQQQEAKQRARAGRMGVLGKMGRGGGAT